MIRDLRDWLAEVERVGRLRRVEGADPDLELGAIAHLNNRRGAPVALLFDRIKGYAPGFRILAGASNHPARLGVTLRLGPNHSTAELVQALRGKPTAWAQAAKGFDPLVVRDGPVVEVVEAGAAVDLTKLPAPRWNELDGGRYLGTGCQVLTRDPETGWVNASSYRVMLHDSRSVGVYILAGKHGRMHYEKWWDKNLPCPMAISLGHDPLFSVLGGVEIPLGVSELNVAGVIRGEPVEVLESDVTGLPIPARSEVVIEGLLRPHKLRAEGPFGEFFGYYSTDRPMAPVLDVQRVLRRADPIIIGSPPGKPPHDYSYWVSILRSALVFDQLVAAGVPGVQALWVFPLSGSRMLQAVAIQQMYPGHSRQAGVVAAQCRAGAQAGRYTIVVDGDIDPTNLDEVMWAVATRSDPQRDIDILQRAWGGPVDPLAECFPEQKLFTSRAIIDACRPYEHLEKFPPVAEPSPELRARVLAKWRDLLSED
jgi:UbiD family decarboxylase